MNLTDTYSIPMKEVLEQCNIVEQKIHTDNDGNIQSIEVKYVPQRVENTPEDIEKAIKEATERRKHKSF